MSRRVSKKLRSIRAEIVASRAVDAVPRRRNHARHAWGYMQTPRREFIHRGLTRATRSAPARYRKPVER